MDDNLREMGVGDLSVPKRMQAVRRGVLRPLGRLRRGAGGGRRATGAALDRNIYSGGSMRKRATACRLCAERRELACGDARRSTRRLRFPAPAQGCRCRYDATSPAIGPAVPDPWSVAGRGRADSRKPAFIAIIEADATRAAMAEAAGLRDVESPGPRSMLITPGATTGFR